MKLDKETPENNKDKIMSAMIASLIANIFEKDTVLGDETGQSAKLNGETIPYLPVGTKLNVRYSGEGNLGTDFETSLIRKIAAGLGVSHEELSKNMSETIFVGVKQAINQKTDFPTASTQMKDSAEAFGIRYSGITPKQAAKIDLIYQEMLSGVTYQSLFRRSPLGQECFVNPKDQDEWENIETQRLIAKAKYKIEKIAEKSPDLVRERIIEN